MKDEKSCCSKKTRKRSPEELRKLINRLNRIDGQVNGIKKMLESDAYCTDILIQVSACQAAFNSFTKELLASHIRNCVVSDIKNGNDEVIDDLVQTLQKLMK
ncbi:metal-sensing transcriptional repressor [Treponema sp.]|uniref:metal-sensing transcriptional repressor n=1 Tax=Treponema sp. TaxID=166 RepID=UPI003F0779D0